MGFKYIKLVMDHSKTKGPDRAIMLALAYRADDFGACWPSFATLAKDSGLTRRTIYRRLNRLVKNGELSIKSRRRFNDTPGGRQSSHLYAIKLQGRDRQSPPSVGNEWVVTESPQGEGHTVPRVGTESPQGRDSLSPESYLNPQLTIKENQEPSGGFSLSSNQGKTIKRIAEKKRLIEQALEINTPESLRNAERWKAQLAELEAGAA